MKPAWGAGGEPEPVAIDVTGWLRVILRLVPLALLVFGGLALLLLVRLFERPLCGMQRPVTPYITQFVCRNALRIIGLQFKVTGTPMRERGAVVANHSSWLDIFALNAAERIYFVAKSEVAGWAGIGKLARSTGTMFVRRDPALAKSQTGLMRERLMIGHKLLFFPEGTSTDGSLVLPFKTTLFEAFLTGELRDHIAIQPVSVVYRAPEGADPRFYGWWGNMEFGSHLLTILAPTRQGSVEVMFHPPLHVRGYDSRKALALAAEKNVRAGHENLLISKH